MDGYETADIIAYITVGVFGFILAIFVFILAIFVFLLYLGLWFLPTIIAALRGHNNLLFLFLVNLFLSWTVIGWIFCLVWSFSRNTNIIRRSSVEDAIDKKIKILSILSNRKYDQELDSLNADLSRDKITARQNSQKKEHERKDSEKRDG